MCPLLPPRGQLAAVPAWRSREGRRTRGHPRGAASPCCSGTASGSRGPVWVRFLSEPGPWTGLHGENIPPIRNVTAWLPPHSQGTPRNERCTGLLLLLTLHVLLAWLTLQRFLTWKREVGLTSHTLTLTFQAPERPGCQGSNLPVLLFQGRTAQRNLEGSGGGYKTSITQSQTKTK